MPTLFDEQENTEIINGCYNQLRKPLRYLLINLDFRYGAIAFKYKYSLIIKQKLGI